MHTTPLSTMLRYGAYGLLILTFILAMSDIRPVWITLAFVAYAIYLTANAAGYSFSCRQCNFRFISVWFVAGFVFILTYFQLPLQYYFGAIMIVIADILTRYSKTQTQHSDDEEEEDEKEKPKEHDIQRAFPQPAQQAPPQQGGGPH